MKCQTNQYGGSKQPYSIFDEPKLDPDLIFIDKNEVSLDLVITSDIK